MYKMNHTNMDAISQKVIFGHEVWNPRNPLSDKLMEHLFSFNEQNRFPVSNGLQRSDTDSFVELDASDSDD